MPPEWLIGPAAALVLALVVINELWKAHKKADDDVTAQRDRNAAGWEKSVEANEKLADGQAEMSKVLTEVVALLKEEQRKPGGRA